MFDSRYDLFPQKTAAGAFIHYKNLDEDFLQNLNKIFSMSLCNSTLGQIAMVIQFALNMNVERLSNFHDLHQIEMNQNKKNLLHQRHQCIHHFAKSKFSQTFHHDAGLNLLIQVEEGKKQLLQKIFSEHQLSFYDNINSEKHISLNLEREFDFSKIHFD